METLPRVLRRWATERPDATAFVLLGNGERESARLSFAGLEARAAAIAAGLVALDLTGRPVLIAHGQGLDYIAAFCGCLAAGAIAVPAPYLLPKRSGERIAAICADAGPAAVLTSSRLLEDRELRDGASGLGSQVPWIATDTLAASADEARALATPDVDAVAFLQYTSGSTGAPRGTMITHGNLAANVAMMREAFACGPSTRIVSWLPMFHDMGLVGTVLLPLFLGVPSIQMSPLAFLQKPVRWLRAIATHRATHSAAPNFAYDLCARVVTSTERERLDLSSWEVAVCAAEPVRPATLERFASAFAPAGFRPEALQPCYGLAETTVFATGGPSSPRASSMTVDGSALAEREVAVDAPPESVRARTLVSSGRGAAGQRLAIVDPETRRHLPDRHPGEIWIAGPHVSPGYWNRAADSAATFGARLVPDDGERYLRTGDLGFTAGGTLFVTGRSKDLMIVRGAKHHPEDIEQTVASSHPALAEGVGTAFAWDDGTEARVVVLHEVGRHRRGLDLVSIERAARGAVLDRHGIRLDDVRLLRPGTLPRTTSGKVQRQRCRDAYEARLLAPAAAEGDARPGGEAERA